MTGDRTLQAIVESAQSSMGAQAAWIVIAAENSELENSELEVVAAAGDLASGIEIGQRVQAEASFAGFVMATGQPIALQPRASDDRLVGIRQLVADEPSTVVSVPCAGEREIAGALEIVNKATGPFDFDDVEIAVMLAQVAGTALEDRVEGPDVPTPEELGRALRRLADADAARYQRLAEMIATLLSLQ